MLYALLAAVLVAADQVVKYLVRTYIPLGTSVPFLPGLVDLTYVQNTGAAFSILSDHTWVLTLISAVVSVVIAAALLRGVIRHPFGVTSLPMVLAGAVGNLIDRALFGFVTDMFDLQFMPFAVFNVADICVVCGGIAFCIYFLFYYDMLEKKEEPHDSSPADG